MPPTGERALGLVGELLMGAGAGRGSGAAAAGRTEGGGRPPGMLGTRGGPGICGFNGPTPTMVRLAALLSCTGVVLGLSLVTGGIEVSFTWAWRAATCSG